MATTTQTRPSRAAGAPRPGGSGRLPEGWLRGLVSGVEAAVLSWLAVAVPAVAAYIATAAAPALGDASWQSAAGTGTALWLLAHGGDMTVGEGTVSVVPLGMTLLSVGVVYAAVRRLRIAGYGAASFAVVGFVLSVLVATLAAPGGRLGALLGGAVVSTLGTVLAARRSGAPAPAWSAGVPAWVRDGLRGAGWILLALALVSLALVVVALVTGWDRVRMVQDAYMLAPVGLVVMTAAQLLYLPTVAVWALAWSAGPGFAFGAGTHFAAGEAVPAPLPAIPLLGGLPSPEAPGPTWVVVVPVAVGVIVGVLLHRRASGRALAESVGTAILAAVVVALAAAVLTYAASGGIGPGRMAEIGAEPPAVAGMLLAEVGAALLLTVVVLHPRTAELVGLGARRARERVSGASERLSRRRSVGPVAAAADVATATGQAHDAHREEADREDTDRDGEERQEDGAAPDRSAGTPEEASPAEEALSGPAQEPRVGEGWSGPSLSAWSRDAGP
ncbi:hypothetical protein GCM10023169_13580 [Georgenia halophila]|uniref:PE-PGRS family protein n=2 Tax=Georgenia halophila TaxID=620889 RepID=A0ABP8KWR9_9MICO